MYCKIFQINIHICQKSQKITKMHKIPENITEIKRRFMRNYSYTDNSNGKTREFYEFEWQYRFNIDDVNMGKIPFVVYLVYNPSCTNDKHYMTAILRNERTMYSKSYGFSNYMNTAKYVLKAILADIEKLSKDTNCILGYFTETPNGESSVDCY